MGVGTEGVHRIDRTNVERPVLRNRVAQPFGNLIAMGPDDIELGNQILRGRNVGHLGPMLESLFPLLKGGRHVEDGFAVLDGGHPPRGEGAAVSQPIHEVDHRGASGLRPE